MKKTRFLPKKCPWKENRAREDFRQNSTREKNRCPWKILSNFPRENDNFLINSARETDFLYPWRKREKTEKSARETIFPPVKKIEKMGKNDFHGHFWFSREKKKNTDSSYDDCIITSV